MKMKSIVVLLVSAVVTLLLTGCLVKRTVTVNGQVQNEDYEIKRPIKEAVQNSR